MPTPITTYKLVSWNVNGLRAVMQKQFAESLRRLDADMVAIQETKLQQAQLDESMTRAAGYDSFWSHCHTKKGYSGVGIYSRIKPLRTAFGIGVPRFDCEGRILEADFGRFIFFNVYFPNGQMSAERLQYKLDFYQAFFDYADAHKKQGKSLVVCGDFNTAHNEIDLANPKANEKTSGFLRIERDWLDRIVERGYVDTFRHLHPDEVRYSWWTYRFKARERNIGWRIDYFFVTRDLIDNGQVREAFIDTDIQGSDHCPIGIVLTL
jgi:exodeoxyribonuclease-3